jgi:hypothetical protein
MLIDTHVHVGRVWDTYEPVTPDGMLSWMDDHGVEMAVPLPVESPESASYYITTREMLALCAKHPDRFIPFCVVDARMLMSKGRDGFRELVRCYVDAGAVGFGEVKIGLPIDDSRLQTLYGICDEFRLPLLFHCDHMRCTDTPDLKGLEAMLKAYPNVTFIGHAPGFWSAISADVTVEDMGGYPTRPVVPGGRLDTLLTTYPNLYADISAGSAHNALVRDWAFGEAFLERNHGKLMFATDYLYVGQNVPQFEMFANAQLTDAARTAIGSGNARRLFGLS